MRYLLNFKYSGTYFHGYSIQNDKKTVEGEIEKALLNRFNKNIKIVGCSRTDSKVHSLDHYAHFDIDEDLELEKLKKYLNDFLNGEIYIKNISKVNKDFHARYNVKKKTYVYKINVGEFNPIEKDIVYQYCKELNIELLNEAKENLIGKHDFKAFTPTENVRDNYVREIYDIKIVNNNDYVFIYITGNGFLRYMIRIIVGLFLEINEGKKNIIDIKNILEGKDRSKNAKTVDAEGLYLYEVIY